MSEKEIAHSGSAWLSLNERRCSLVLLYARKTTASRENGKKTHSTKTVCAVRRFLDCLHHFKKRSPFFVDKTAFPGVKWRL
ncbi:MAG: hypothetical protein IJL00_02080 [Clostridia bacterium]|nr:hypothetical protein [Clostridia bacterium]